MENAANFPLTTACDDSIIHLHRNLNLLLHHHGKRRSIMSQSSGYMAVISTSNWSRGRIGLSGPRRRSGCPYGPIVLKRGKRTLAACYFSANSGFYVGCHSRRPPFLYSGEGIDRHHCRRDPAQCRFGHDQESKRSGLRPSRKWPPLCQVLRDGSLLKVPSNRGGSGRRGRSEAEMPPANFGAEGSSSGWRIALPASRCPGKKRFVSCRRETPLGVRVKPLYRARRSRTGAPWGGVGPAGNEMGGIAHRLASSGTRALPCSRSWAAVQPLSFCDRHCRRDFAAGLFGGEILDSS
jgi:hypothetical protein